MQRAPEEKSHSRKAHHRFRRSRHPFAFKIFLRFLCAHLRYRNQTNIGELCRETFQARIISTVHRPSHVRLPGTNPYLTHQYIGKLNCVTSLDGQRLPLGIDLERLELHPPRTIFGSRSHVRLSGDGNCHFLSRRSPTPDGVGMIALQHHMTTKNGRKLHFSLQIQSDQKKKRCN